MALNINGTDYVTTAEAAQILGMHPGSLRNRRADKVETMATIRVGAVIMYPLIDVERLAVERGL